MNPRSLIIFSSVAIAIVVATLLYLNSSEAPHKQAVADVAVVSPEPTIPDLPPGPENVASTPKTTPDPVAPSIPAPTEPEITEDDRRIHEIISSQQDNSLASNTTTAQNLLNLLPTLKPDRQTECAQHIANLLDDREYRRALPIWRNASFNKEVLEVLGTDLMNRSDDVKLPAMLDAAKQPGHPFNEEAKSILNIFLDNDYGTDWTKWDAAIKTFLKDQAAAAAPGAPDTAAPPQSIVPSIVPGNP
jgi:hypothetical protein